MLENCVCVVYDEYNTVEMFDCGLIRHIEVTELKHPWDMVGCNETLFIGDWFSAAIWRVDSKTGTSGVFVKLDSIGCLSLVENRLLVMSRGSLLMYDIQSGASIKTIPLPENMKMDVIWHAIESNRDSFFAIHGPSDDKTVSEMDSDGRVIRVLDNSDQKLDLFYLALDSRGTLLVADYNNSHVALLDENLKFDRILFDRKQLDNGGPLTLNCLTENRVVVGMDNGRVKIFDIKLFSCDCI